MNQISPDIAPPLPPLVLVGADALAARLVGELAKLVSAGSAKASERRWGKADRAPEFPVTVLVSGESGPFVELLRGSGARVVTGSARDMDVLEAAGVGNAAALVLLEDDDVLNLHAALAAREINSEIRLVIRMFDERLASRVRGLFGPGCAVLSASAIAAPSFVDAALGDGQQLIEVAGRTLNAGPPATVIGPPLAVLARTDPEAADGTELLPDQDSDVELVLGEPVVRTLLRRPNRMRLPSGFARWASSRLRWTLGGFCALVAAGTVVFHQALGLGWLNACYAMVSALTTGAPDDLGKHGEVTLFTAGAMLAGVVLIALITAFAVDDLVSNRLAAAFGPPVGRVSGHVVVCGLGTVGLRMVEQLRASGVPVVGIEREPDALVVATARRLRVPIVRGDASDETTLRHARAERAQSVVAMTDDDHANIEVGLAVWALDQHIRIVLRLFDQDLSDRITGALPQAVSLSVSAAAAPVFLAAILGREVRAAIGHGRRVLLVAELPVGEGSSAEGAPLSAFDRAGEVRIFGHLPKPARAVPAAPAWAPDLTTAVRAGDAVLLVATRAGLTDALLRTGASTEPADGERPAPPASGSAVATVAARAGSRRRQRAGAPANRRLPPARAALRGRWRPVALPTRWLNWDPARAILDRREAAAQKNGAEGGELPDGRSRGSR
jgi:voltage-gated potassium channel Kch